MTSPTSTTGAPQSAQPRVDLRTGLPIALVSAAAFGLAGPLAGTVLVTNNEDDFRDYPGLQLENWVAA